MTGDSRTPFKLMQDYSTRYMTHNVEELVEFITSIQTLEPGDIIATGTPPGVGKGRKPPVFLKPGDVITAEIEGICSITTPSPSRLSTQSPISNSNVESPLVNLQ